MGHKQWIMKIAILISLLTHAIVIFGVYSTTPSPKIAKPSDTLEIILVNKKTATAPAKPDALAQVDSDGGGNTEHKYRARSPLPVSHSDSEPALRQTIEKQKQLEEKAQQLMARLRANHSIPSNEEDAQKQLENQGLDPEALKHRTAMMSLAGEIAKDYQAYQEKPRKTFVGARTRQSSVAFWVDSWTQKIERVGTLAYPVDSTGKKLYGQLRIAVEINENGTILSKNIEQQSGNPELDQAALRILERAAPFPRLPSDMLDNTGKPATILVITKTWIFGKGEELGLVGLR